MGVFAERAKEKAAEKYKTGINCAETIVMTFDELCNLGIGENVKLASGFGGGLGRAGDICGALSGAIIVLGAFKGRPKPPEGELPAMYPLSKGFHDKFVEAYEDTDCDVVRKFDWGSKEQKVNCLKLISGTAGLLADYLVEQGLAEDK